MFELGTDWAGGVYKVIMIFPDEYPSKVIIMVICMMIMMMIVIMNDYYGNDYDDIDDTDEDEDEDDADNGDINDKDDTLYDATSSTSLQIVTTSLFLLHILSTSLRSVGSALRYTILMCIHQVRHVDGSIDRWMDGLIYHRSISCLYL